MIKVILHLFLCMIVFFLSYKDLQQQEVPSSVNPQYENVPGPPQSVLSMKECAAYGVVNMHSNIN